MVHRHVLAALDAGIAARDEDAARAALRRVDPIARVLARRQLERILIGAALACSMSPDTAAASSEHIMRLAALTIAKQRPSITDVEATKEAYAQLPKPRMPRLPIATALTLLVTALLVGSGTLYVASSLEKPSRTFARKLPAASADAFVKGGVPLRDAAIDKLLTQQLTDLVVEAGRARDSQLNKLSILQRSLAAPGAMLAHGVPLTKAWDNMLEVFVGAAFASNGERSSLQREHDMLAEAVRDVSEQLQAVGLGYFLEGRIKNGYAYIQAYRVDEVVFVKTNGAPRRVLSLRRLDKLDLAYALLGMHTEDRDPVLHLERIDENVASDVMPVLADGATYPLADREWSLTGPGKALSAKVGEVVRREYEAALGADAKAVDEIAKLLIKRNDIVDGWRDYLERKRIYFVATENLFLPPNLLDQLQDVTPSYQRNRVRELEERLAAIEAPRIHARIHDMVAATVRRYEAQHGFDYDRETELRYPAALQDFLGPPHDGDGNPVSIVRSARAELSAYLSQVANDPVTPQAALWQLAGHVFHRERVGTGEYYAGIVVLEGLARQLAAAPAGSRRVSREELATAALVIAEAPTDKLRAAARSLWTELYGEPCTEILDAPATSVLAQTR